jgi:hypothetical protein
MMINVVAKRGGTQKGEEGDTHKKVATRSSILATGIAILLRLIFACMYVKEDDFVCCTQKLLLRYSYKSYYECFFFSPTSSSLILSLGPRDCGTLRNQAHD